MNGGPNFINSINESNNNEDKEKKTNSQNNINTENFEPIINETNNSFDLQICDSPFICNNEKFLVDTINNKIISFYSTFKYLKFKYKIKNSRRNQIDCLIKRIKTRFHNSVHEALKHCLNIYIYRLPQFFITNVKIDFNKSNLNKTIGEIYTEYKLLPSLDEIIAKNLFRRGQKEFVIVLLSSMLKNVYKAYLLSELYKIHINNIKSKEGENFAHLYNFVSIYVLDYFLCNKGNKMKHPIDGEKNFQCEENNAVTISNGNTDNNSTLNNENNKKKSKKEKLFKIKKY